jgi:hypothetical protein
MSKLFIRPIRSSYQSKGREYIESRNSYMYILDKIYNLFSFEIGKNNKIIGSWWLNYFGTCRIEEWWLMIGLLGFGSQGTHIHLTIRRCAFFNTLGCSGIICLLSCDRSLWISGFLGTRIRNWRPYMSMTKSVQRYFETQRFISSIAWNLYLRFGNTKWDRCTFRKTDQIQDMTIRPICEDVKINLTRWESISTSHENLCEVML